MVVKNNSKLRVHSVHVFTKTYCLQFGSTVMIVEHLAKALVTLTKLRATVTNVICKMTCRGMRRLLEARTQFSRTILGRYVGMVSADVLCKFFIVKVGSGGSRLGVRGRSRQKQPKGQDCEMK